MNNYFFTSAQRSVFTVVMLFTLLIAASLSGQTIRYVKPVASGTGDGSSWDNASGDLQAMIDVSAANNQVWVAEGTYKPTSGTDRTISFSMKNGVAIYGGFSGTETQLSERNLAIHVTILSGDIGIQGDNSDNTYNVVRNNSSPLTNTAILDGFVITHGNANGGNEPTGYGGGMKNSGSSPTIQNCIFRDNSCNVSGGGVHNLNCAPRYTNCIFRNNFSSQTGGGLYNQNSSTVLTNCTFYQNSAGSSVSGGISSSFSNISVTNCIIWGNSYGIFNFNSTSNVTYSLIQGGYAGTGNINTDPFFVSTNDLRLQPCSPAINAGDNASVPSGITTDLDGNPRFFNSGTTDMGAYEYQGNAVPGPVVYVNDDASGNNDGSSWTDAFTDLQDALALVGLCSNITEIWVAAGTYKPTSGTDRSISFAMKNGVAIYGGFNGTETQLSERDWKTHVTILNGNIGSSGDMDDNSFHVIKNTGLNNTAVLDGFTISGGSANILTVSENGSGMYNQNSSPTVTNCIFTDNNAYNGAGMYNQNSSPKVTNCSFYGNMTRRGGGMYNEYSSPTVINCIFTGNGAADLGGGMYNTSSTPALTNCSFSGNIAAAQGGAMYNMNISFPTITNCIIWGNSDGIVDFSSISAVSYSVVQGGFTGTGNLDADPMFVSQPAIGLGATGDLRLRPCSPAIDAGNNAANTTTTDLDGNPRTFSATGSLIMDMGAYEYQTAYNVCTTCFTSGNVVYVNDDASGNNDGTSWSDAFTDLQDALALAGSCSNITEIWVAAGTYQPVLNSSFSMKEGVAILGGFPNTGNPGLAERNYAANTTILQGNGTRVINNDNNGLTNAAILDGFTITGGSTPADSGPGAYNMNVSPTFRNCIFTGNTGYYDGSLILVNGSAIVSNCAFLGNTASVFTGGIYMEWNGITTSPRITNCSFSGNTGPGIYCASGASPLIQNSIVWGNNSGILFSHNSNPTVTNCIVQGGFPGTGNLDIDPLFVNQPAIGLGTSGDLRLRPCSPAINAGSNAAVPSGITTDLDGNPRFYNSGIVDMGAFEYQGNAVTGPVVYVNDDASGNNDGTSWTDAFTNLQDAIDLARTCSNVSQIWIAEGTYIPSQEADGTTDSQADFTFYFNFDVEIYGGFPNTSNPGWNGRDRTAYPTILSGDVNGDDGAIYENKSDNVRTVVYTLNVSNAFVMDGFTIRSGYSFGNNTGQVGPDTSGAGWYNLALNGTSSPVISNNTFLQNNAADFGGALCNISNNGTANPEISACTFDGNWSYSGGAMSNYVVSGVINASVSECVFKNNQAGGGGAVYNLALTGNCIPQFVNCLFISNYGGNVGGAVYNYSSTPDFTNCTFSGNVASYFGGAMVNLTDYGPCSPSIQNCIFWNNNASLNGNDFYSYGASATLQISYSLVQGNDCNYVNLGDNSNATCGDGMIYNENPLFVDISGGDFRLLPCSPAINAGDNTTVPSGITTDLDGHPRFYNSGTVDMGAYEYQAEKPSNPTDGGEIAADQNICTGEIPEAFTSADLPSGYVGNLEYQWQKSTTGASSGFGDISGANSETFAETAALTETTWYKRLSRIDCKTGWTDAAESNVVEITVEPTPVSGMLAKTPNVGNVCEGTDVSATLTAGSGGNGTDVLEYRTHNGTAWSSWATYTSGTNISTTDKTQVEIQTLRQADYCNDATTNTVSWIVEQTPVSGTLTKTPDVANVCEGTDVSATLTAGSGGNGTDVLEYRTHNGTAWSSWASYTSGTDISTTDKTQVEIQTIRQADYCNDATANTVSWIVDPETRPGSISGSSSITYGSSTGDLTLTRNVGSILKWQKRLSTSGTWTDISNTSNTYSETPASAGTWEYSVLVQSGTCDEEYAEPHEIMVEPKELTIGGSFTANDKIYDDNTDATFDANDLELTGVVGTDDVYLTGLEIDFASKTTGEHTVTITSASLAGADKDNYTLTLTGSPETTATIHAGPPVKFLVTDPDGNDISSPKLHNIPFDVKVTLVDAYDNPTPNTGGNVTITLTGSGGATPGDLRFQGFPADPVTQTLNAGDTISDFDNVLYTGVSAVPGFDVKVSATAAGTGTANGKTGESNLFSVRDIFFSVEADPTSILADGTTKTDITVTLEDHNNNPLANQTITVETDKGTLMEGAVELTGVVTRNTDANGQVFLQLRSENVSVLATVTAKCPGACPQTVKVAFTLNAPVITSFTPGEEQVDINFTPPSNTGLTTISNYEYSLNDGTDWTAFSPAQTGSPVTITGLTGGQTYLAKLRAVNEVGTGAASEAEEVYSCFNPTDGGEIGSDQTINNCETPAALTSNTAASGHYGTLEYQWQKSTTSATDGFSNIGGATSPTLQPETLNDTTWYRRLARVSCKPDWTEAVSSNVVKITVKFVQTIQIPQGWSYISSYLEPTNPNIVNMWADIVGANNLAILTGTNGIYAPAPFYINTLNNWDVKKGYKVKMNAADELQVKGVPLNDNTVTFTPGAHLIPVLTNQNTPLDEVFNDPANDILYMLDLYQNLVYWPGGGINTLTDLVPGKGYLGNFKNPVTLTYPELGDCSKSKSQLLPPAEGPWPVVRTSNYHLISVLAEAINDLQNADYIGAFDSQGNCVGYAQIENSGQNVLLTVYGDEPMTNENDGITEGELLRFRSFNLNENSEKELTATYNPAFPNVDGLFVINGLSGISGFKESATGAGESNLAYSVQVYPNPATDVVNIVVPTSLTVHEASGLSGVEGNLLTTEGKPVKTFTITSPETQLDVSGLQPGIYLLKIASLQNIVIKRVVIQ